jgi:hypothetical protein
MSDFEELLWFVCSLVNLAALIMSWVQIFEILQLELQSLDEQHQVRRCRARRGRACAAAAGRAAAAGAGRCCLTRCCR